MIATHILTAALISGVCCAASAQSNVRPGSVDLRVDITHLALQPFSLEPNGGATSVSISSDRQHAEGTLYSANDQFHDSQDELNKRFLFFHFDPGPAGEWVGVSGGQEPSSGADASILQPLLARAFIRMPDTPWQRIEGMFSTSTVLHLSANSGLTVFGQLDASQAINPVGRFSNETFASFDAELIGAAGDNASYAWNFGTQGGNTPFELFSLTVYNRSNEAADITWNMETNLWATVAVPEPTGIAMMLAGFGLLGVVARRRQEPEPLA